ncbi:MULTISPECIES: hypothetical protein [unclassified Bradyrhizobium]|uniref:hypothetical protein n=1 Tax=unclassified Bradyrhizobium TaxID=2631580 RepID=UPI0020B1D6B6|nr:MULTISPECIES: hypothetical protein [unclassified Bradyrhizobium]MCP3402749.1 hypothetical protein [Bradyrhizobium sp. CCGB20]MCP3411229.1 hypothetical protein [Bradyrhizobium sp. CCGB01]
MQRRSSLILSFAAIPLTALAEPVSTPSSKAPSAAENVHVQPRGKEFMPNSIAEDDLQKRITDFNQKQEGLDAELDKKLKICRGC